MTENIKHMRQIIEHNDLTNEMTRAEASVVLDLIELEMRERTKLAYHTAPGELEFAPEGWTWKQQAARDYDRLINAERENEHLKQRIADLEGTIGNTLL